MVNAPSMLQLSRFSVKLKLTPHGLGTQLYYGHIHLCYGPIF